jgi:hypothetical protein
MERYPFILITGMIRSGSTWSFNVCVNQFRRAGYQNIETAFIETLGERPNRPAVLKCHVLDEVGMERLRTNPGKFVYTFRDPREVAASAHATFKTSIDDALSKIEESLAFFDVQRAIGPVCIIPYRDVGNERAVQIIADYLDLSLPADAIASVAALCRRESVEVLVSRFGGLQASELVVTEWSRYHRETLLHHNHFRPGDAPRWQDLMDEKQQARAAALSDRIERLTGANLL